MAKTVVRKNPYQERLDRLECHFKWRPEIGRYDATIESIMEQCETGMEECPFLSLPSLALLAYLHTLKSSKTNVKSALKCIENGKALQEDSSFQSHVTCDFVLRANELHILYLFRRDTDEEKLSCLEKEWSERESKPQWEAEVWGAKGFTMSRFGLPKYEEGIKDFERAMYLDMTNPHWCFGKALLLSRQLRADHGLVRGAGEFDEIIDLLNRANELAENKIAVYASFYGHALAESLYPQNLHGRLPRNLHQVRLKSKWMMNAAIQCAGENQSIYRQCAKVYKWYGMFRKQKECLLKGIEQCRNKGPLYHALGNFYRKNRRERDLAKAKEYLTIAVDMCRSGNSYFWADLDLLKVKIEADGLYDALGEFYRLETKYTDSVDYNSIYRINLCKERGLYLLYIGNNDEGVEELLNAVELESNQVYGNTELETDAIIKHLSQRARRGGFKERRDLARFYQQKKPENQVFLIQSEKEYHQAHKMDASDEYVIENFAKVLMRLHKYQEARQMLMKSNTPLKNKELHAEVLLALAEQHEQENKEELFHQCMTLGCKNGAMAFLSMLENKVQIDLRVRWKKSFFQDCAQIAKLMQNESSFYLKTSQTDISEVDINQNIRTLLDLDGEISVKLMRQLRYEMSLDTTPDTKFEQVICEARFHLDKIHKQFGVKHFPNSKGKSHSYFPLAVKADPTDKEKVKIELSRLITSPKESHGGWANFSQVQGHKFEALLEFLADKQMSGMQWLVKWFDLVNIHKHERELTSEDYNIPNFDTIGDPYELAHQAAEFTEEVVAEYQRYM